MNVNRKIQITASTVIANGALALGLLTTNVAMACPTTASVCLSSSVCPSQQIQTNQCLNLNRGCLVIATQCYVSGQQQDHCSRNEAELYCFYR